VLGKAALRKIRRSKDGFDFAPPPDFDLAQPAGLSALSRQARLRPAGLI